MSLRTFQSAIARLVADPDFRDKVREGGLPVDLCADLTVGEQRRVQATLASPGLGMTRVVHNGWRLSKLLATLPFTTTLLGPDRVAEAVSGFWRERRPANLHFGVEALAFCSYLERQPDNWPDVPYLADIVAFERARLELSEPFDGGPPRQRQMRFRYDPAQLLGPLSRGEQPSGVEELPTTLTGTTTGHGVVEWQVVTASGVRLLVVGGVPPTGNGAAAHH